MRITKLFPAFLLLGCASPALAQQKVFEWQPANDETVRLDPANYHSGRTYGPQGGEIHVDITAERPVTIFLTGADEWNRAMQYPETMRAIRTICLQEHVVKTTYTCDLPLEPMTLIIRDERESANRAAFAGLGAVLNRDSRENEAINRGLAAVLSSDNSPMRRFSSPNDLHIQYYRWVCVSNCFPPQFQWIQQAKEKYELSSFLKVYGGYTPGRDGEVVSIKLKSPVPMLVAVIPSSVASQLHGKPDMLEPALEKTSCQQRGVQSQTFQCTFNSADGPQSLIVVPEDTGNIPHKKKAEVEFFASKCVANCVQPQQPPANATANNPNQNPNQ